MKNKLTMRKKIFAVFLFFSLLFLVYAVRLGYLQLYKGSELQLKAEQYRMREVTIAASRGVIYDRNGSKLAISLSAESISANPAVVKTSGEAESTAIFLASVLGMAEDKVYDLITADRSFQWVKRKADFEQAQKIREADLPGIEIIEETMRFYPKEMLACHILGGAGVDNQGLDGIELTQEEILAGTPGSLVTEYDAHNNAIPQAQREYTPPSDGKSLVLTIDETIQYFCERELDKIMASETPPKGGTIIVMDPNTCEILAMANRPGFDPNKYGEYDSTVLRNKAVTDVYEPGSTFKILLTAAALEEGVTSLNDHFYCPGYIMIGKMKLKCWRSYNPHGSETLEEIVQNSCNPGFVTLAQRLEAKQEGLYYDYIKAFGIGQPTGIELPGEASGIMVPEEDLIPYTLGAIAIGQSISVTPLQLITAVSAVANGGTLMEPQIVRQVLDQDGNVVQDFEPKIVRRVVSEETATTVRDILEKVVAKGTGRNAYIEGYRVGGKTGTAQKVAESGGYMKDKYIVSFMGMAPTNDPRLVCLVVIDEPQEANAGGGVTAAPIFKAVMEDSLRYLGVVSQQAHVEGEGADDEAASKYVAVPDVTNLTQEEATKVLRIAGLNAEVADEGTVVTSQTPAAFSRVENGTTVALHFGSAGQEEGYVIVPDLTGMRVREVAELLSAMGLKSKTSGAGTVKEQFPIPGTKAKKGDIVTVTFGVATEEEVEDAIGP